MFKRKSHNLHLIKPRLNSVHQHPCSFRAPFWSLADQQSALSWLWSVVNVKIWKLFLVTWPVGIDTFLPHESRQLMFMQVYSSTLICLKAHPPCLHYCRSFLNRYFPLLKKKKLCLCDIRVTRCLHPDKKTKMTTNAQASNYQRRTLWACSAILNFSTRL